ncbi:MAG: 4-hydroxybenzoate octaprenyltransferase [Gammaproteobacteria bacterium]|nr:4-hydroxybenzoate octaprenyltransferase [Gammaproteobacteria bacterium]
MPAARACLRLMRLDRPIGTFLLLWPTLWALWLATDGTPPMATVAIFIAGAFVMRAAGCVINDIADRRIDPQVKRTRDRPLAGGELTVRAAWLLFALLLVAAAALALQLSRATQLLALVALPIACAYPLAKRVTHLPQLLLGVAFSWGIPMAYMEVGATPTMELTGELPAEMWLLFAANFAWVVAYDTQYAMVDRDDDARIGVGSTAILFGRHDNRIIGALHLVCLGLLAVLGRQRELAWAFYIGLGVALALAVYQQWLCKDRARDRCFRAFLNNNWLGAAVFAGLVSALPGE